MALDGIIGNARLDANDTDAIDPAADDDVYLEKINKYYLLWHEKIERRITSLTPVVSGLTGVASNPTLCIPTDWIEVVSAFSTSFDFLVYGAPLEIVRSPADIFRLQAANPTPAIPRKVAFQRKATSVPAEVGRFEAFFYPIPTGSEIGLLVRKFPPLLVNPTDVPDINDLGAYTIGKLVAAEIAGIIGEDQEYVSHILRDVSDEIMAQMGVPRPGVKRQEEMAA